MEDKIFQCEGVDEKKVMVDNSLVSIITPVLNGIKYLEICIQSVLNQTYPNIEHIFIDGGSTDGTLDILKNYKSKYSEKIRFISEPDRGTGISWNGAVDACNKGWKIAKGDIFGWLGVDDTYESGTIMTIVKFFRLNQDAYFVFGSCNIINEKNEIIRKVPTRDFILEDGINDDCYIPCTSAFYKREVIETVGFLDTSINSADLDYWMRVGKIYKRYQINKTLSNFRIHKESTSGLKGAGRMYIYESFIISRRHGGSLFSGFAKRYYKLIIIESLRPIFGFIYPIIKKILKKKSI